MSRGSFIQQNQDNSALKRPVEFDEILTTFNQIQVANTSEKLNTLIDHFQNQVQLTAFDF